MSNTTAAAGGSFAQGAARTVFPVVLGVSAIHMLNDSMQAVVPAICRRCSSR